MISIGDGKGNTIEVDFFIDEDNILQPLGVLVTNDSRCDLLPQTKDSSEEVPGLHGEIDFGTEFKGRTFELSVVSLENEYFTKKELQYMFAKYLDPTKGYKSLVFADDIDKIYYVKYSGRIQPDFYANWFKFTIPLKMSNPFIYGTFEKSLNENKAITNDGTFETGFIAKISGPTDNPTINLVYKGGMYTMAYTGTIVEGETLTIDTEKQTAKIGIANALNGYNGVFPMLEPGITHVIYADNNVNIKWRDKWI